MILGICAVLLQPAYGWHHSRHPSVTAHNQITVVFLPLSHHQSVSNWISRLQQHCSQFNLLTLCHSETAVKDNFWNKLIECKVVILRWTQFFISKMRRRGIRRGLCEWMGKILFIYERKTMSGCFTSYNGAGIIHSMLLGPAFFSWYGVA